MSEGDCLTGTARWTAFPGSWEKEHLFGSAFRPVLYEASLEPWDSLSIDTAGRKTSATASGAAREALLKERIRTVFSSDVAGLTGAMVLSDTTLLPPDLLQSFQRGGVYHLLSVSGEHVALLALFLSAAFGLVLRFLPYSWLRKMIVRFPVALWPGWFVVPVLLSYLFLIGLPLPAVRAGAAFVLLMLARSTGGPRRWPDILGLSILALGLFYPMAPLSLSVDLSLMALWGLYLAGKRHVPDLSAEPFSGEIREKGVRDHLWTGAIVMGTTLPLLWFFLGKADWIGIVSNVFTVPVAGDLFLPLGFLSTACLWFDPGGWPFLDNLTEKIGQAAVGLVDFFARIPFGQISLPALPPVSLLLLTGLILLCGRWEEKEKRPKDKVKVGILFAAAMIFAFFGASGKGMSAGPVRSLWSSGGEPVWSWRWDPGGEGRNLLWLLSFQGSDSLSVR
ncbi:MAG: ComEC/Rec2 family competence protein [Nitrospirae bacterium]|nr:ComEC/Rec2 family competence protein [Nitrospirota bacterium]